MGLRDVPNRSWREGGVNKAIGGVESTLAGIWEKTSTKIEVHSGMAERVVRDLAIQKALQEEIKETLEHNNQSHDELCDQTDEGKNNTSFSWPYMIVSIIWNSS